MAYVALIGASGRAGSAILKELSDRGHKVTAIARNPEKIAALPNVTAQKGDALDGKGLAARFVRMRLLQRWQSLSRQTIVSCATPFILVNG
jgi:putative NADH-flavin reductase